MLPWQWGGGVAISMLPSLVLNTLFDRGIYSSGIETPEIPCVHAAWCGSKRNSSEYEQAWGIDPPGDYTSVLDVANDSCNGIVQLAPT